MGDFLFGGGRTVDPPPTTQPEDPAKIAREALRRGSRRVVNDRNFFIIDPVTGVGSTSQTTGINTNQTAQPTPEFVRAF